MDSTGLDGKEVFWDDFGGLPKYLDLLAFCRQRVASLATESPLLATEPPSFTEPLPLETALETNPVEQFSATAGAEAAILPNPVVPAAPPAGVTVAAGPIPARVAGAQPSLPIGEPLPVGESLPIGEPLPVSEPLLQSADPTSLPSPAPDSAAAFVSACGVVAPQAMIIANELYGNYLTWCRETGQEPLSQRSFGMRLTGLGFDRKRRGRGRHWWIGLGLAER